MKYFAGDCVEIVSEIDSDKVTNTVITLVSITDPRGVIVPLGTVMTFGTGDEANIASATYQLAEDAITGRYKYLCKSSNGSRNNYAEGYFFIEDK